MIVDLMLTGVKFQAPYQVHIDVPVPAGHFSELECCFSKLAMTPLKASEQSVNVFGSQYSPHITVFRSMRLPREERQLQMRCQSPGDQW